jgi:predicted RNA methylase
MNNLKQITGLKRNTIDKYYTKSVIAKECINIIKKKININKSDLIIEPSAGNGSFVSFIKMLSNNYRFYDIEPEVEIINNEIITNEIIKQDFLELDYTQIKQEYKKIHIIGNPPFGRQSSLAIKFIKRCCEFAESISFILPKSFKKDSMKKKFKKNYHLIYENDIKENSFLVNGIESNVPCVFQIWQYKNDIRDEIINVEPINYKFVKKNDNPDISFRRIGINAGTISKNISNNIIDKSEQSHYFIKFINNKTINIENLKEIKFDFNNTVGPKSISKQELIKEFNKVTL